MYNVYYICILSLDAYTYRYLRIGLDRLSAIHLHAFKHMNHSWFQPPNYFGLANPTNAKIQKKLFLSQNSYSVSSNMLLFLLF